MAKRKSSGMSGTGSRGGSLDILRTVGRLPSSRALKVDGSGGLTRLAIGQNTASNPIQFGTPSSRGDSGSSTKQTNGSWPGLLGSIARNGVSELLGGGVLSSGLDYLVGGFESLFGAGSTSGDALSKFELPDAVRQSTVVNNVQRSAEARQSGSNGNSQSQISQLSKAVIIKTVKDALLTSSGLNDVIGEL